MQTAREIVESYLGMEYMFDILQEGIDNYAYQRGQHFALSLIQAGSGIWSEQTIRSMAVFGYTEEQNRQFQDGFLEVNRRAAEKQKL